MRSPSSTRLESADSQPRATRRFGWSSRRPLQSGALTPSAQRQLGRFSESPEVDSVPGGRLVPFVGGVEACSTAYCRSVSSIRYLDGRPVRARPSTG
jgi:hypothetical protein